MLHNIKHIEQKNNFLLPQWNISYVTFYCALKHDSCVFNPDNINLVGLEIFFPPHCNKDQINGSSKTGSTKLGIKNPCIIQTPAHQTHQECKQLRAGMGERGGKGEGFATVVKQ